MVATRRSDKKGVVYKAGTRLEVRIVMMRTPLSAEQGRVHSGTMIQSVGDLLSLSLTGIMLFFVSCLVCSLHGRLLDGYCPMTTEK